jgi:hypothetical protein
MSPISSRFHCMLLEVELHLKDPCSNWGAVRIISFSFYHFAILVDGVVCVSCHYVSLRDLLSDICIGHRGICITRLTKAPTRFPFHSIV